MGYKIRLALSPGENKPETIAILNRFDNEMFPKPENDKEKIKSSYWWLAYDDEGKKVGYAGMRYLPIDKYGFLCRVGVRKKHRGNGIQKRLIRARLNLARKLGWKGALTYVANDNYPSMVSLLKMGFKLYWPEYAWGGNQALYMYYEFKEEGS